MISAGLPEAIAAMNAQALTLAADGDSDLVTDDVLAILGRPARTLELFVSAHAAASS